MRKLFILLSLVVAAIYLWPSNDLPEYEQWYQMTWKGNDVGFMRQQAYTQGDIYEIRTETRVKTANQGVDFSFNELNILRFSQSESQPLISSYYRLESPHNFTEAKLEKTGSGYQGWQQLNNKKTEIATDDTYSISDYLALYSWLLTAPDYSATITAKALNPSKLVFYETTYQIDSIENNSRLISHESSLDNERKILTADDDGFISRYAFNKIISLQRVSDKSDLQTSNNQDYYASQMVPLDKPLGDPLQWQTLRLRVNTPEFLEQVTSNRRQSHDGSELTLTSDISAISAAVSDKDKLIVISDKNTHRRLNKMATDITRDYSTSMQKITALREFVSTYIADVPRIQSSDVAAILASPEGDCTEHTALFNALVQSLGFPARSVSGLVYLGDNFQGFGGHQWSEVLIDDYWVGFDATWNISTLSATHIRFNQATSEAFFNRSDNNDNYQFTLLLRE